ncbi:MAG: hypothetical protein WAT67_00620 [Candidatus Contendobacter sp.]
MIGSTLQPSTAIIVDFDDLPTGAAEWLGWRQPLPKLAMITSYVMSNRWLVTLERKPPTERHMTTVSTVAESSEETTCRPLGSNPTALPGTPWCC